MKSKEVLRRYNKGERDFRRINIRGQSFKKTDLSGADFSEADIRGADFTNAYLKDAKFCGAKAGLQRRWVVALLVTSFSLSGLLGFLLGLVGYFVASPVDPTVLTKVSDLFNELTLLKSLSISGFLIVVIVLFFIIAIRKSLMASLGTVAVTFTLTVTVTFAVNVAGVIAVIVVVAIAVAVIFAGTVTSIVAIAGTGTEIIAIIVAVAVAVAASVVFSKADSAAIFFAFAGFVDFVFMVFSAYIGWRVLAKEKHIFIRRISVAFAAIGGTSFRYANLTDADFSQARLKSTDFRQANLTRTCFRQAKKLDRIRSGTTYLRSTRVRQLLITGEGQHQNFSGQSLRGVNLQGANLADTIFVSTDLSEANLQDADLSRAILVQTQLDETDLTGATLTGATIEDWGITSHTQLQRVRCRYVFMRLPTKEDENRRRKPDNWEEEFKDGDFADFIKPIVDTLDLYHNQGVDPRAIAISLKQLAEDNPEAELKVVAMEKRGENNLLVRMLTAPGADHSRLSAEYKNKYNQLKKLTKQQKELLAERDGHISSLKNTVNMLENIAQTAVERPSFYAQTYNNQGDTMPDKSTNISINNVTDSSISGVAGGESTAVAGENLTGVAGGDISGTV
ncbi:MAG: pentapeptide repeat-containing protein, partial [Symploca sp. SIO3E6]|nr:pentapeptide repeat-containing protein [Caldora sp. SIO3E6]